MNNKIIAILIIVFLISCSSEEENSKIIPEQKVPKSNKEQHNTGVFGFETNIDEKEINESETTNSKTIPSKKLANILPHSIPGTKPNAYKYGNLLENNVNITISSREYMYSPDSYVKFSITDYYNYKIIPNLEKRPFENDLKIAGKTFRKLVINSNPCYILEDEALKEAKFVMLYDKRFIVKIESFNLDFKKYVIDDFVKYINFKELSKLVDKYK